MPGYRQMPKIDGFMVVNRRHFLEINVGDLECMFPPEVTEITQDLLTEYGLLKPKHSGVRLLGNGDVTRKFSLTLFYATPGAKAKIEAAGGQVITG
jgi:large subunit ribosomal protein L15